MKKLLYNTMMYGNMEHNTEKNRLFDPSLELNIENAFSVYKEMTKETTDDEASIEDFVVEDIFSIFTYDGGDDSTQRFIYNSIYEILERLNNKQNVIMEQDLNIYHKHIIVCNILDKYDCCEWGTSIRGAWITDNGKKLYNFMKQSIVESETQGKLDWIFKGEISNEDNR